MYCVATAYDMGPCNDHFLAYMRILPPRSVSMYVCRYDVLKHSFLQTAQPPCIVAQLLVTGWRLGYVLCDVIARKKPSRQIKIRQLEFTTNPPNLIPANFSGHTVYTMSCLIDCLYGTQYRMAGKFGGEFNLADWRICERSTKLNSANIFA